MTPDFSPRMLALFLRARGEFAVAENPVRRTALLKTFRDETRRLAGVTATEMQFAWTGQLGSAGPRAALWAVLGHFPGDHGIVLLDGGGQHG